FSKKTEEPKKDTNAPPPWVGIDNIPKKPAIERLAFDLADFTSTVTGFKRWQSQLMIFGAAVLLGFTAYAFYLHHESANPLPPDAQRPAMDKYASSTQL